MIIEVPIRNEIGSHAVLARRQPSHRTARQRETPMHRVSTPLLGLLFLITPGTTLSAQNTPPRRRVAVSADPAPRKPEPDIAVCEDARVSLGQTKQEVHSAVSLCCRIEQPGADANAFRITGRQDSTCVNFVRFDGTGKLAWASHGGVSYQNAATLALWNDLVHAIGDLLRDAPTSAPSSGTTSRATVANVELSTSYQRADFGTTAIFIQVGPRIVSIQLQEAGTVKMTDVSEEIGDMKNAVASDNDKK